jgi:signal transduction histidine kinase/DNA-binding NarL/FixJ family response regulator
VNLTRKSKPVILCVDDVKEFLESIEAQLRDTFGKEYKIEIAQSGEEALDLLNELLESGREIPVVISDQVMPPGMPGDEFLIAVSQLMPTSKRIMLTGQADLKNVGNAINKAGLFGLLSKTYMSADDLRLTVDQALNSFYLEQKVESQNKTLKMLHESAQVISSQVEVNEVIQVVVKSIFDYTHSESVVLYLNEDDQLFVNATAKLAEWGVKTGLHIPLQDYTDAPTELIDSVRQSKQPIIFADASTQSQDRYLVVNNAKSIFIAPVLNMGKLVGVLFMENNAAINLYTEPLVEIIDILSNAAGIALANAQLYENMEDLVNERTQDLSETMHSKLAVDSHKDKMIHIVSHDIRSPLSGIGSLASLLQDREMATDPNEVMKYGQIIQNSVNSVIKFVEDILDLAKLESGTIVIQKTPVQLDSYLKNLSNAFEPLCMTKGVQLVVDSKTGLTVEIDGSKLAQAINNIVSNAIKFTKKGGKVTIQAKELPFQSRKGFQINISDTGMGIPKEELGTIFDKFNKFQRSGTKGEKGTGLGMSIAKEVVEIHDGIISADSEVGVGTTFSLQIPSA